MNPYRLFPLLRVKQWVKNLMLFFPPFLGGKIDTLAAFGQTLWLAPLSFCLASSATYIVNDLIDVDADRCHPEKRNRPIASGAVTRPVAVVIAGISLVAALAMALMVGNAFTGILLVYLVITIGYSAKFKHLPIADLFCISSGFVMRLFAGGVAFGIVISDWLFLSVFLLSLFLSAGKRLGETQELGSGCADHRRVLVEYPAGTLEIFMAISAATVLVTYTMYVVTKHRLVYTVPLCCFGLFRYMLNVRRGLGGDPTTLLFKDPILFAVGGLWAVMIGAATYLGQ